MSLSPLIPVSYLLQHDPLMNLDYSTNADKKARGSRRQPSAHCNPFNADRKAAL